MQLICTCGKICTSKPGLTLHKKRCNGIAKEGVVIPPPEADDGETAILEAHDDHLLPDDAKWEAVEFHTTARCDETITARRKTWQSLDGRWRVELYVSKFHMPNRWLILRLRKHGWDVVGERDTKHSAFRHCAELAAPKRELQEAV